MVVGGNSDSVLTSLRARDWGITAAAPSASSLPDLLPPRRGGRPSPETASAAGRLARFVRLGGTSAITVFFNRSGIPCVHHDRGRLARRMRDNLAAGRAPIAGYERYRAFTDMDWFARRQVHPKYAPP